MQTKNKAQIIIPITKIDVEKRLVYGTITDETLDLDNEVCDYKTSKPLFEKWSANASKTTGGKSFGNIRAMHQPKAAGKLTELICDDEAKAITCIGKIVDDDDWKKCVEGVYTGYSLGGSFVKTWADPDNPLVKRYTVNPVEVSLVDLPCNPNATFSQVKGAEVEVCHFKGAGLDNAEVLKRASELAGGDDKDPAPFLDAARKELMVEKAGFGDFGLTDATGDQPAGEPPVGDPPAVEVEKVAVETEVPATEPVIERVAEDWGIDQVFQVRADKSVFPLKADAKAHVDALKVLSTDADSPVAKAIAAAKAAASVLVDAGAAPYLPLETAEEVRASWNYATAPASKALYSDEAREAVKTAWIEKIAPEGPPSAEMMNAVLADPAAALVAVEKAATGAVAKGLYTVAELASGVARFNWMAQAVRYEEERENDTDSKLPAMAGNILAALGTFLVEMVQEEVAEMLAEAKEGGLDFDIPAFMVDSDPVVVELAAAVVDCVKGSAPAMEKAGRRNSAHDQKHIQAAHDSAAKAGAKCDKDNLPDDDGKTIMAENVKLKGEVEKALAGIDELGETIKTVVAENAELKSKVEKFLRQPEPMPQIRDGNNIVSKVIDNGGAAPATAAEDEAVAKVISALMETEDGRAELQRLSIKAAQTRPIALAPTSNG